MRTRVLSPAAIFCICLLGETGCLGPAFILGAASWKNNTASSQAPTAAGVENWPSEIATMPREIGAYYKQGDRFVPLFGRQIVGTKAGSRLGGWLPFTGATIKGELPGKHAQIQTTERQPTFYAYMPEGQTPDSLVIIRMKSKDNSREFEVGSVSGVTGGVSQGLDAKKVIPILIERIAPRVYRFTPDRELKPGEYGFIGGFLFASSGVAGAGEKVYDFGIQEKK